MSREEQPVYYREIQKSAYLKRLPGEPPNKLRPLGHKRAAPKAMWTVFCVHNGRTPYLEQYPEQESASTLAHRPSWRVSLESARHVTASVRPWPGDEFDFLVATEAGPVRMLAPDWDSMQHWVCTLRGKLHELRVLERGENVYCAPPAPPPPRAGTRDPTSPLPPTPVGPLVRVPGIEPNTPTATASRSNAQNIPEPSAEQTPSAAEPTLTTDIPEATSSEQEERTAAEEAEPQSEPSRTPDRRSDWDAAIQLASQPTTSQEPSACQEPTSSATKIAKICGQNICLDDSILSRKRGGDNYSDEDFFAEIDRMNEGKGMCGEFVADDAFEAQGEAFETFSGEETLKFDERMDGYRKLEASTADGFTQRLLVSDAGPGEPNPTGTNITVIQVSNNRGAPHTAIPVVGPEVDVFDFEFKQKLSITSDADDSTPSEQHGFVNIVNTEQKVGDENGYGTVFNTESDYGHMSLTTTVELTGEKETNEGIYERLCMASTSNDNAPLNPSKKKNDNLERLKLTNGRKTSLPNLEILSQNDNDSNPTYEYLFPVNAKTKASSKVTKSVNMKTLKSSNVESQNGNSNAASTTASNSQSNTSSSSSRTTSVTTLTANMSDARTTHADNSHTHTTVSKLRANANAQSDLTSASNLQNVRTNSSRTNANATTTHTDSISAQSNTSTAHSIIVNSGSHLTNRSVERSQSQNSYDATVRYVRDRARNQRGVQNHSPRRESGSSKNDKSQQESKQTKGLFKRGLTELSFLSRLKGLSQNGAKQAAREPNRNDCEPARGATSPGKVVVRRSRQDARPTDGARRRSSSLSGGGAEGRADVQPLRVRQAAALRAEQARGAAVAARLSRQDAEREPPVLCDAHGVVWVAWWGRGGAWFGGRAGDRVAAVRGVRPRDAAHARLLLRQALSSVTAHTIDILFHRVPHAKIYILYKEKEDDNIGLKLDSECGIVRVEAGSAAARAGLPPPGPRWAVTELNNRPLNLLKGCDDEVLRLSGRGEEVSVLVQPLPLVQKLRSALKTHRILQAVSGLGG